MIAAQIEERIALVIVDSAMALFRVDFTGRGQLAERQNKSEDHSRQGQQAPNPISFRLLSRRALLFVATLSRLGQFLSQLTKMAEEFNTAVLITNQVRKAA